jgi:hypothetical protein
MSMQPHPPNEDLKVYNGCFFYKRKHWNLVKYGFCSQEIWKSRKMWFILIPLASVLKWIVFKKKTLSQDMCTGTRLLQKLMFKKGLDQYVCIHFCLFLFCLFTIFLRKKYILKKYILKKWVGRPGGLVQSTSEHKTRVRIPPRYNVFRKSLQCCCVPSTPYALNVRWKILIKALVLGLATFCAICSQTHLVTLSASSDGTKGDTEP